MSAENKLSNASAFTQNSLEQHLVPLEDDYAGLRILAVHAHPDDESSKGAASMVAYARRGARVMVATMTGGERGSVLNQAVKEHPGAVRDLPGLRRVEMAHAQEILGIEHRWIGFVDSGLPEGDPLPPLPWGSFATLPLERVAAPLVRLVRDFKPHVILAYDENGGYPHPDHIMSHKVAKEAYEKAGDAKAYLNEGAPWEPLKLYYDLQFSPAKIEAFHTFLMENSGESPFTQWFTMREQMEENHEAPMMQHEITTRIPCAEYFLVREKALLAHQTQVAPTDLFFAITPEDQNNLWPCEDYALIDSRVKTELPEYSFSTGIDFKAS